MYSSLVYLGGDTFQDAQWMPETVDRWYEWVDTTYSVDPLDKGITHIQDRMSRMAWDFIM